MRRQQAQEEKEAEELSLLYGTSYETIISLKRQLQTNIPKMANGKLENELEEDELDGEDDDDDENEEEEEEREQNLNKNNDENGKSNRGNENDDRSENCRDSEIKNFHRANHDKLKIGKYYV